MEAGLHAKRLSRSSAPDAQVGIVHLGLGAFFRSHGAIYIEQAMAASGGDWGIVGVSLQSPGTRDALAPQDFVYTAVEQNPDGSRYRKVEVIQDLLVAREDPARLLALMADPRVLRAIGQGFAIKGRIDSEIDERLRRLARTFNLATQEEVNELKRTLSYMESNLTRLQRDRDR